MILEPAIAMATQDLILALHTRRWKAGKRRCGRASDLLWIPFHRSKADSFGQGFLRSSKYYENTILTVGLSRQTCLRATYTYASHIEGLQFFSLNVSLIVSRNDKVGRLFSFHHFPTLPKFPNHSPQGRTGVAVRKKLHLHNFTGGGNPFFL